MARRKSKPTPPFRSHFEERIAGELDEANVEYTYEQYQLRYDEPLRKNMARCGECGSKDLVRTGWYTPDFYLVGSGIILETKGRFTAADRRKMVNVCAQHPEERIVMLFMSDNKIHAKSTTRYSDWCMQNGIEYAVGSPHKEWLK